MNRKCNQCNKDYEAKLTTSKFCSGACRAKYSNLHKSLGDLPQVNISSPVIEPKKVSVPKIETSIPGLDVQTKYVINALEKESARWEKSYEETLKENKTLIKQLEEQKEKIRTMETDKQMAEIQGSSKSSLEGLGENPLVLKAVEFIGPALGKGAEKLMDWIANQQQPQVAQMAGLDANNPGAMFLQWLGTQSETVQTRILKMLQALSSLSSEYEILDTLGNIERLVLDDYMKRAV